MIKTIIVGAYGLFLESLITRLKKETGEIFVITGSNIKNVQKHGDVIEEYNFKYDDENVEYILDSIKPELVVFTGALDPNFSWNEQKTAVTFIAGLNNLLLSAVKSGVKRFIYMSSTDVYDKVLNGHISEQSPANPKETRPMTIKNGEDMSIGYAQEGGMEVVILRCSEVFGYHNGKINTQNYLTNICLKALRDETLYKDSKRKHDNIHVNDVVESTYRVMIQHKIPHSTYNICSSKGITEEEILKMIGLSLGKEYEERYHNDSVVSDTEYSNELALNDSIFSIKNSFEQDFKKLLGYLNENKALFIKNEQEGNTFITLRNSFKSIFGWFFPYLETIIAFLFVHIIAIFAGSSSYMEVFDFYLLYVVLIAIIYGKGQTIIALLLCLIGKIMILQNNVSLADIIVDYNTYVWMLQLLIIGMGIGYIRDRYQQGIDDKEESINYLQAELTEIKEINHSNIRIKKVFENRLINYQDSFARIYSIVTELNDLEPDKIMFATVDVVSQIMKSDEIVIYGVEQGSNYARLTASSVKFAQGVPKSIKLNSYEEIYSDIAKHKIYINRSMDSDQPSMAGGVFHEDTLEAIVMIWSLPFENTTLYNMNLFSVVLGLVAQAMHRANQYIEVSKLNRYIEGTSILTAESFLKILEIKQIGFNKHLADYYIIQIVNTEESLQELNDIIMQISRQNDYLGIFNDNLCLLLTNANEEEAQFVIMRLAEKGIQVREDVSYANG